MGNAGGAATNSGIDFQQRVAALVLAHILADVKVTHALQLNNGLDISEVRFETCDNIDDLVIISDNGRVLIQAKRSLSLSNNLKSEYSEVLKQFVGQYVDSNISTDIYVLATSSKSSQRITKELRKLTESVRLNETGASDNPLTKTEIEVLEKTNELIKKHYLQKTGNSMPEDVLSIFFKRIHVSLLDIEAGSPLEAAVLVLLSSKTNIPAELLWGSLIALCVSLAKDRLSINKEGLLLRMGSYIEKNDLKGVSNAVSEYFSIEFKDVFAAGREVLLVKSILPKLDYLILELYRFNKNGTKRLKFNSGKVELPNGEILDVVFRAATMLGIERLVKNFGNEIRSAKVGIVPLIHRQKVDENPYAKAHAARCAQLIKSSVNLFTCLHCGDPISEDGVSVIEIDEVSRNHQVGLIHDKCLLSTDRILGVIESDLFRKNKSLRNFDYTQWFLHAARGQGLFNATSHLNNRLCRIAWQPNYNRISKGGWCIKINLDDGSARYVHERGRVMRHSAEESQLHVNQFNAQFDEGRDNRDPWCYTSVNDGFGTYSTALQVIQANETCIRCVNAEAVIYTQSIGNAYTNFDNYYAPLLIMLEAKSGKPLNINGTYYLLSKPLNLDRHIDNWLHAGLKLPDFVVSTILSDDEFDKFVRKVKDEACNVIIDPMLKLTGDFSSGFILENFEEIISGKT